MTTKQSRVTAALADAGQSPPQDPQPAPDKKARRSPTDVQRDRLTERIARLESERKAAVVAAAEEINENAEKDRLERIAKSAARITARFGARIEPLRTMLDALGKNGASGG